MDLQEMVKLHVMWAMGDPRGKRLEFHGTAHDFSAPGIELAKADFSRADLYACDFSGMRLPRTSFRGADLRLANFRGADLRGCDFRGADLRRAVFSSADLREAMLMGSLLHDNYFDNARMTGAVLRGCDTARMNPYMADFRGCIL